MNNLLGGEWLREKLKLYSHHLTHRSYLGTRAKVEVGENSEVIETYTAHYAPGENTLSHIVFYLKYDDINLDFLKSVFSCLSMQDVANYIQQKPKGRYERRIGLLYEYLTENKLPIPDVGRENYIDLLNPDRYVTGKTVRSTRWNINNNLLGDRDFCPIIRKTKRLENSLQDDFQKLMADVRDQFPQDIFHRAVNYLYTKETRSSYQIEKEQPSPEREQRFVALLEKAGAQPIETLLSEMNLTKLQNEIVDPRYAAKGFRHFQNYIGQTMVVTNPNEVESYFRYPDLTEQVIYLARTIKGTITEDIYLEMDFLMKYDEVKAAIQGIVDMPDRNIDMMIKFLHQNKGELAARKRKYFEELTDDEIARIQSNFKEIFGIGDKA
jgi:hypothetical protein